MKNIFDSWFSPSGLVDIPQYGFDEDIFLHSVNKNLNPLNFTFQDGIYRATLRNSFFRYKYEFEVKLQDKASYHFSITNFAIALFTTVLVGAFLFRGHISTYFFWSVVAFFVIYGANFFAVKNFLVSSLQNALTVTEPELPSPHSNISITRQSVCPACGQVLWGFENECPECGLNLTTGKAQPRQSVSNFKDYKICYQVCS